LRAATCHPLVPGQEINAEPIIVDTQIAVATTRHGVGHNGFHLLRHDADIASVVVSSVAEAIDTDPTVEPPERHDVLLEPDVGEMPAESAATESPVAKARAAAAKAGAAEVLSRRARLRLSE